MKKQTITTNYRPDGRLMLTAGNGINQDGPLKSLEALLDEVTVYGATVSSKRRSTPQRSCAKA
jgi:hypothetical protein